MPFPTPTIEGVPPSLSPLLLNALKTTKKQISRGESYWDSPNEACRIFVNAACKKRYTANVTIDSSEGDIPISCMKFLFDMVTDVQCKLSLRRAAMYLSRLLLNEERDCREFLAKNLSKMIHSIERIETTEKNKDHLGLLQQEVLATIESMVSVCDDKRFLVAARFLREQKGVSSLHTKPSINGGMIEYRRIRDFAIKNSSKQCHRVCTLLQKASECLDILAPSIIDSRGSLKVSDDVSHYKPPSMNTEDTTTMEEESVDDDSFEWEDGDSLDNDSSDEIDHEAEVEHTIKMMQMSRALTSDGELLVDFNKKRHDDTTQGTDKDSFARKALSKCVKSLKVRHLPRMLQWIDALTLSDCMIDSRDSINAPLLLLPLQKRNEKSRVLNTLSSLREEIVLVIDLAEQVMN